MSKITDWLQRYWWIFPAIALLLVAIDILPDLVLDAAVTTSYQRKFDGYMLVFDLDDLYNNDDPTPVPLYSEPTHLELEGKIRFTLRHGNTYIGAIRLDGYQPMGDYAVMRGIHYDWETRPVPEEDNVQTFTMYTPLRDTGHGCHQSLIGGQERHIYMENELGERPVWLYTLPEKDRFCISAVVRDAPPDENDTGTGFTSSVMGYMIFPARTPEEAREIFTNEYLALWREVDES